MDQVSILRDIAERTGGEIYLGVVGPVRSGKSAFIKRFMELLVIPNIKNPNDRNRTRDELPQSGAGRTIMTTEPKFIPDEAVEIAVREGVKVRVRVVDCVGYTVAGASGYADDAGPRMVRTPWFEQEIPFQEAAEVGTRKVIADHSTMGIVVTTDGSITGIPRENYVDAEERVIWELKELDKPFVVLLNTAEPEDRAAVELARNLEEEYNVPVLPVNCAEMGEEDFLNVLNEVLYEFPVTEVNINMSKWVEQLDASHWLRQDLERAVETAIGDVRRLRDVDTVIAGLGEDENVQRVNLADMDLGTGTATIALSIKQELFYNILEQESGLTVRGDHDVLRWLRELSHIKAEYDKIAPGLLEVKNAGYGLVMPGSGEMELEEPELIRQGGRFGVRLKARAPSYHFIRADITTELTPLIGSERQCEDLMHFITDEFESDPKKLWETNLFGKSLYDVVRESIQSKLYRMPENAQVKLQETLERIVNEGSGGLICIII